LRLLPLFLGKKLRKKRHCAAYRLMTLQLPAGAYSINFAWRITVNTPRLKGLRRDEQEQLPGFFNQSYTNQNTRSMLVSMSEIPERFHPLIRRLQAVLKVEDTGDMILIDDDFFEDMKEIDRQNKEAQRRIDEAQRRIDELQRKKEEALREEQAAQRKEETVIRILLDAGIPPQVIAQKFGMSEEDVRRIEGNAPA
jgi:hypothetical protein